MTTSPDADLATALERATSWLRRAYRPQEWNSVALFTLDSLARGGPRRVTDLVAQERITQPGMTGIVARFVAAGLVTREPDPTDGRATLVSITPAGREYVRSLHAERAAIVAEHVAALPPEHRDALRGAAEALSLLAAQPVSQPVSQPVTLPVSQPVRGAFR